MNITDVDNLLAEAFGRHAPDWKPSDPLFKLITRVVGQRTTGAHAMRAMSNLMRACESWADVARLDHHTLADLIRGAGLARQKSASIHQILEQILLETGEYSLDCLHAMETPAAFRFLCRLPGVGPHTAALVLMFAMGRSGVMPVESHIHRVARRLGWAPRDATVLAVQKAIEAAAPAQDLMDLHVNLIRLGQRHCGPAAPDCLECPISDLCATARLRPE